MKVMIVDDELPIREWIRMMIQKVDDDVEVVACVASGEEGYKSFMKYCPELIISDIKMGNMDGIELLKKVKEAQFQTYFVLLTSHNDFNYARDGIRYGANEYILKTEVTLESIAKIVENFKEEKSKVFHVKKKEYIEEVFAYDNNEESTEETQSVLGESFFVVSYLSGFDDTSDKMVASEKSKVVGHYYDKEGTQYFIFQGIATYSRVSQYNEAFNVAQNIASLYNIKVGFSGACYQISTGITKARKALELTFYQEGNSVTTFSLDMNVQAQNTLIELRQKCIKEIYNDNIEKASNIVKEILELSKNKKFGNINELKNILVDILHAYKLSLLNLGHDASCNMLENIKDQVIECKNYQELYTEVTMAFSYKEDDLSAGGQYSVYTKKAIIFINENYKANISLIDIVERLNINSEYFCRIFKKETGKTFLTYLTDYKMKKAEELLIKSDLSIQEISDKLGYSSVAYFSRVFKNKTGENPYKYRSR